MAQLLNKAEAIGMFDGMRVADFTELRVELSAIEVTKTADKDIWVSGPLTYTIVVKNIDTSDPDDPGLLVTDLNLTDNIDTAVAALVDDTVRINGNPAVEETDYTYENGVLTFISLEDLAPGAYHTITFQVELVL